MLLFFKSKKIILLTTAVIITTASILLWSGFLGKIQAQPENKEYTPQVKVDSVDKVKLNKNVSYSGTLEGMKQTDIAMKVPGEVNMIKAEVGDKVKSGEVLAASKGENQRVQEKIRREYYLNSVSNLRNTRDLMQEQVENARINLKQAKNNLELLKTNQENTDTIQPEKVKEAEIKLKQVKTKRKNLINSLNQQEKDILDTSLSSIRQSVTLSNNVIEYLYSLNDQSLSGEYNDFDVSDKFITPKSQLVIDTGHLVEETRKSSQELKDSYFNNLREISNSTQNKQEILQGAQEAKTTIQEIEDSLWHMKEILNNSSAHSELSQAALDRSKQQISQYINQVQQLLLSYEGDQTAGLVGVEQALANLETKRTNQLNNLDQEIELAKQKLSLLKNSNEAQDSSLERKIKRAEIGVEKAKQGLKTAKSQQTSKVQEMETQVENARGKLEAAQVGTDDTLLKAPYTGVITKKYIDEGRMVKAGSPIFRVSDISQLKLIVYIPKNKLDEIKVGDKMTAVNKNHPEQEWKAEVTNISPASEPSSQKNKVELKINNQGKLNPGMYMQVKLSQTNKEETLAVPTEAIFDFHGSSVVYVVQDGKVKQKTVQIQDSQEDMVYIENNLSPEDKIVTSGGSGLRDGDKVELISE